MLSRSKYLEDNNSVLLYSGCSSTKPAEDLARYLGVRDYLCPLIGKEIEIIKELGSGHFGKVFLIKFIDEPSTLYVVKKLDVKLLHAYYFENKLDPVLKKVLELSLLNSSFVIESFDCAIPKKSTYNSNVRKKKITVSKGSIICPSPSYTEYLISSIVGTLKLTGICMNFIETFEYNLCTDTTFVDEVEDSVKYDYPILKSKKPEKTQSTYIFSEYIEGETLNKINKKLADSDFISIIIQSLFAIHCYQLLGISHNDLHGDNIMLVKQSPDDSNIKYYSYIINNIQLYFPVGTGKYIVKIIDWGLSTKYTYHTDTKISVIASYGFNSHSYGLTALETVPNEFVPAFDIFRIIAALLRITNIEFIKDIDNFMFEERTKVYDGNYYSYSNSFNIRKLKNPYDKNRILNLFNGPLFEKYRVKPPVTKDEILILGKIQK